MREFPSPLHSGDLKAVMSPAGIYSPPIHTLYQLGPGDILPSSSVQGNRTKKLMERPNSLSTGENGCVDT